MIMGVPVKIGIKTSQLRYRSQVNTSK
jgi:hypothetical protein